MLQRTARRRLETTLLASRQSLPRPARLYSSPTAKNSAPATATATASLAPDFPFFPQTTSQPAQTAFEQKLSMFLHKPPQLTIIPPPTPPSSRDENLYFIDSKALDMTGIIDACLHNLQDVARAQDVFSRLRVKGAANSSLLNTSLYNAFVEAYIGMAQKDESQRELWIREAWQLYDVLETEVEEVAPNAKTYSLLLYLWHKLKTKELFTDDIVEGPPPARLLSNIVDRDIPVMSVISNQVLDSPEVMTEIAKVLSAEAVNLGLKGVLEELGHCEELSGQQEDIFKDVPQVRPVLKELKKKKDSESEEPEYAVPFNLDALRRHLYRVTESRKMLDQDVNARQRHLESSVYDLAVEQLEHRSKIFSEKGIDQDSHLRDHELQNWMFTWHNALVARLKDEIVRMSRSNSKLNADTAPFMTLIKPEKLSLLTILELMRLQGSGGIATGMKTTRALIAVGKSVENEYKAEMCKKHDIPVPQYGKWSMDSYFSAMGYQHLHQRRLAAAKTMEDGEAWSATWSQATRSQVGAVLVECLMEVAEVTRMMVDETSHELLTENQPAFFHAYEYVRGTKLGVIKINPIVSDRIAKDSLAKTIHPRHLPMLVKPKPWLSYNEGGYIYNRSSAMRFKESHEQEIYLKEATNAGRVELVYAGLDILGSTPWRINKGVFDVVLEAWNSGDRIGKLPPAVFDSPEPVLDKDKESDMQAKSHHIAKHKQWVQRKANNHSERCSVNYKIEIARAFLADKFYLPHNLDFRGRAYPIPPHFNHIGDDLSRGLLMFAEPKPLGARGLRWLKIHIANLYGYDKAMFDERVQWVEDRKEVILDSATNPLNGQKWWMSADDPWQCLATCMEYKKAHELEDPTTYESCLPVHQDGTCNGLQHYAALGGDAQGAKQVNLAAADRPSDVYTHVALAVDKIVNRDAAAGLPEAILLQGKIARKVVKQTVMTTVYGVTFVGARDQIEKQLRERKDLPHEKLWGCASYLAKHVLASIGETFRGARAIQTWLNLCARLISKSIPAERLQVEDRTGASPRVGRPGKQVNIPKVQVKKEQMTSVIWTTPLGLPIVQPYRKTVRKQVMTAIQSVYISDPYAPSEVNSVKQASAFPPNFIHSLDATHMMLTALECRNRKLTFASVHDSYWTHACDVDTMSEIIRETFIALHSSDVLGKLNNEIRERYEGYQIPLDSLGHASSALMKNLVQAGTRVKATEEQAKSLKSVAEMIEITDDEHSNVTEMSPDALRKSEEAEKAAGSKKKKKTAGVIRTEEELLDSLVEAGRNDGGSSASAYEDELALMESEPLSKMKQVAVAKAEASKMLAGKFVNLTDLIPPLPDKGTFEVESIKKSQYFFS